GAVAATAGKVYLFGRPGGSRVVRRRVFPQAAPGPGLELRSVPCPAHFLQRSPAVRVTDFLAEQHVAFETIMHPPAFTAQKRAKYLHVPGQQVAKSVLLVGPHGFFLAVLPATLHVDTEALGRHLRGPVRLATDEEITDVFRDCEWGVV